MGIEIDLSGDNAAFYDALYSAWAADPASVGAEWRALFEAWGPPENGITGRVPAASARSLFSGPARRAVSAPAEGTSSDVAQRQSKVAQLVRAWRSKGHAVADIDPLGIRPRPRHPELELAFQGLDESELDLPVASRPLFGEPPISTVRRIYERLKSAYGARIGAEVYDIQDIEQRNWVSEHLERLPDQPSLDGPTERRVLRKLSDAENFERYLHNKFPGTKRFSLEGAETLIPLLDLLLTKSAELGAKEIVLGMAHRGRLNVLANTLGKPVGYIVKEFQGGTVGLVQGSGDVKYHLGHRALVTTATGKSLHVSLTPNPSHLEAVDPLVAGRVRAKQDRIDDKVGHKVVPVLLHGDAAFIGQGLVAETFNLSELAGYSTGGTIHVVINNQIGFTTPPLEARSTVYATDMAKMLGVPVFHVNGEDPRAVCAVVEIAVAWRQKWHRDVVIDMYCYRKYGHNEGDEPAFTQPLMYDAIRKRQTPREVFTARIFAAGDVTEAEVAEIHAESQRMLELSGSQLPEPRAVEVPRDVWGKYGKGSIDDEIDTTTPIDGLRALLERANTVPDTFHPHPKVIRLLQQRMEMIRGERRCDWAIGEMAAYATLGMAGVRVRLSGQDSGRGTFTHRHAVLADVRDGTEYYPLSHLDPAQAPIEVIDSPLSEQAVLGFDLGYSWDYPDALVLWEAQFGDFANGAQIVIDQFLVAAEQKWSRYSGIVLLLPHGYEGQGPEHSSARLERFLTLSAEDNMQVANISTPANLFHLLRRQALRTVRKPLVILTPKSLLRHELATSTLEELATGRFQAVLADPTDPNPADVKRVVLCSGKVWTDLHDARGKAGRTDVAIVRVELLYPWPRAAIAEALARYPGAEVVWCQEEPANMGAWPSILRWNYERGDAIPRYAGRKASASPATGSITAHQSEQARLVADALGAV